jgi:hypothetical protein
MIILVNEVYIFIENFIELIDLVHGLAEHVLQSHIVVRVVNLQEGG